jgi:hypothetical protein
MELVFQCHISPLVEQVKRCSGRSGWNCSSLTTIWENVIFKILHYGNFENIVDKLYSYSSLSSSVSMS